jgi:ribosomal protein S18 acetylase RimI-like enzyme
VVRAGRDEDVARVAIIERAAASLYAPYGLEAALTETPTPTRRVERAVRGGELLVATDASDRAVGYALFSICRGRGASANGSARGGHGRKRATHEPIDLDLHLEEIAVMPSHGRRGLGTSLLDALAIRAREEDADRITLVTLDFVPFGAPFYLARGYEPLDALPRYMEALIDLDVRDGRVALFRSVSG